MATVEESAAAFDAVLAATRIIPAAANERPARFILLPAEGADPKALTAKLLADFAMLGTRVEPLSAQDQRVLVLILPGRALADRAIAFEAAYALIDAYDLEQAEPDYDMDFFPVPPPPRAPGAPTPEAFPP